MGDILALGRPYPDSVSCLPPFPDPVPHTFEQAPNQSAPQASSQTAEHEERLTSGFVPARGLGGRPLVPAVVREGDQSCQISCIKTLCPQRLKTTPHCQMIVLVAGWYAKDIINNREETKRMLFLSQEATKRTRIIAGMAKRKPSSEETSELSLSPFKNDQEITPLDEAKQLFEAHLEPLHRARFEKQRRAQFEDILRTLSPDSPPRAIDVEPEPIEEAQMDGLILRVFSGDQWDGYRAEVQCEDGLETLIDIPNTAISSYEKSILQKSEWEKSPLYMHINLKIQRGEVISAKLIHADTEDRSKTNRTSRHKFNKHLLELPSNQMIDDYSR